MAGRAVGIADPRQGPIYQGTARGMRRGPPVAGQRPSVHFGAKGLILDEPAATLSVKQAAPVLRLGHEAKRRGLGVVLITHQVLQPRPLATPSPS